MICVIGGGAAGFFAAINAASQGCKVTILEKGIKVLSKVRISGGGRCNVTNGVATLQGLLDGYPRGNKELRGPFTKFSNQDTMNWFEDRGVRLKVEKDGRVFPVSDDSGSIIDCLLDEADRLGVAIKLGFAVECISTSQSGFIIHSNNNSIQASKVIVTTGGGSKLESYKWLQTLGVQIVSPVPSLFTINIPDSPYLDLMGVSVQDALVSVVGKKISSRGPILFTHWGLSGPAILKCSSIAARQLHESNYEFDVQLDLLPDLSQDALRDMIREMCKQHPNKKISSLKFDGISTRLFERLIELSGIEISQDLGNLSKQSTNKLVDIIKATKMSVRGKTTFKEEFVTCGGVSLKEIDFKRMESKVVPNLFFAGEVLDIDGVTGGFNFQAAWTTGFIAGTSACNG
ncbi:MAG: NAD(P)/FAD-dependent oxidoreductase [Bacteroidota bacterium]